MNLNLVHSYLSLFFLIKKQKKALPGCLTVPEEANEGKPFSDR